MNREEQLRLYFYEQLVLCFDKLTPEDRQDLLEFEKKWATSEWPGWDKYLERTA